MKRHLRTVGCALALAAGCQAGSLIAETSATIPWEFGGQPIPRFENGLLLARDMDRSTVRTFDATGRLRSEFRLALPDTVGLNVKSVAAAPDGSLAANATVRNVDGTAVSTIIFLNSAGRIARVVRTTPFAAFHLAFAPDGTLWAIGREHGSRLEEVPDYNILRQYDRQGKLVRGVLAKSGFPARAGAFHPAFESWLAASRDRVGLFCVSAGEYVEVSLSGETIGRWKTDGIPPEARVSGIGVTAAGDVYVSAELQSLRQTPIYRLDKTAGQFVQVNIGDVAANQGGFVRIAGSDDNQLVLYTKPPTTLIWAKAE